MMATQVSVDRPANGATSRAAVNSNDSVANATTASASSSSPSRIDAVTVSFKGGRNPGVGRIGRVRKSKFVE